MLGITDHAMIDFVFDAYHSQMVENFSVGRAVKGEGKPHLGVKSRPMRILEHGGINNQRKIHESVWFSPPKKNKNEVTIVQPQNFHATIFYQKKKLSCYNNIHFH